MAGATVLERWATSAIDKWIAFGVRRPKAMMALWGGLLAFAAAGLTQVRVETSGESILDKTDPSWAFYQESLGLFGNDEVIVAAVEARTPYDPETLAFVDAVSRSLAEAPEVRRIDSISTLPIIEAAADGSIRLDPAVDAAQPIDASSARRAERRASADPIANRSVVSDDGRVFAVNVWPEAGMEEEYARRLVERVRGTIAAPGAWVSGVPVFRTEVNLRTQRELGIFVPLTVAVMIVLLFLAFQGARGVIVPLTVSGVSVVILFGLMGWLGVPISAPTLILPSILLAVGCAYAMHLLTEVDGHTDPGSLEAAARLVSRPIALSGLTTAVSFASTAIVPIEAVERVGVLGAAGAMIATAATTGLGSAIVSTWHGGRRSNPLLGLLRRFTTEALMVRIRDHAGLVIAGWAAILAVGVFAATRLHVESDVIVWFPRGNQVRDDYEAIKTRLSGISPLNVVVRAGDGERVTEPDVLRAIDDLSHYLASMPEVGKTLSIADPLRLIHARFGGETLGELPGDQAAIEQYLLLLEGTERLGDVITSDRTAANVMLRVNDNGSHDLLEVASKAEAWWREHGPSGTEARTTGSMFEYARAEEAISSGQIQGLVFDVAIIGTILLVALRSVRLAIVALIPNVLPIGLMFGFMGASRIPLDMGTVFVSNLAVGIAIDETIHLITAYAGATGRGSDPGKSLQSAMVRVVPTLVLTTVVIACGFLVLSVSEFRFTRNLGLLTAGVMVLCVASNATLLPALLWKWGSRRGRDPEGATHGVSTA